MTAILARRLADVRREICENWRALLCGVMTALVVTPLLMSVSDSRLMNTVAAVLGDFLGFYGCLWVVAYRREFRYGTRRVRRTAIHLFKKYWAAEIFDTMVRATILAWTATVISTAWLTTLTGNFLADIVFFGVAVLTGVGFSDVCIGVGVWIDRKYLHAYLYLRFVLPDILRLRWSPLW